MGIETERLLIRSYSEEDLEPLACILGDATTMGFWPRPFSFEEAQNWLQRNMERRATSLYGRRALLLKATGELIGDAGVVLAELAGAQRADLGYIIHHAYWGQGYASEAAHALVAHAFGAHCMPALFANMAHDHRASQRVAERVGMRRLCEFVNPRNRNIRTYLYGLERPSY